MIDHIKKVTAPLQRRIMMAIARGIIRTIDDSKPIQQLQVSLLADEVIDRLERIQQYGFSSHPKKGAEAVAVFLGGSRDHGVVIAVDDRRYRKKNLEEGEVALYTDEGDYLHFKRNGEIWIQAAAKVKVSAPNVEVVASTKVTITSPSVEVTGDLDVGGNVSADGDLSATNMTASSAVQGATVAAGSVSIASIQSAFNGHTHVETGATTQGPSSSI